MDYKQKYNKLVDAIKVLQETNPSDESIQNWVNDNVPELYKSEDERARKDLIHLVKKSHEQGGYALHKYEADRMLAWLERQCENPICKVKIGEKYKCIASPRYSCFYIGDVYEVTDDFIAKLINLCSDCFVLLEKQGE